MVKISLATFTGISGADFEFDVYSTDTQFTNNGGVYVFSKRVEMAGKFTHYPLYIGETENLSQRIPYHEKWECAKKYGVNCICVHLDNGELSRKQKEEDLVDKYDPPCNR